MSRLPRAAPLLVAALLAAGCSPQAFLVRQVADQLAAQGDAPEDDPQLAKDAAAFYLKLSESLLARDRGHLALAESVSAGFTRYAYAFVATEADRIEFQDARGARDLRERAARLYRRARGHAVAALAARQPELLGTLAAGKLPALRPEEVGVAYWAAASWAAWISLSTDRPEVVADLPLAARLAAAAHAVSPGHGGGALASLMGTLEAARPGGDRQRAARYFDEALVASGTRPAGVLIARAEALAQPAGDRTAYEDLLRRAVAATREAGGPDADLGAAEPLEAQVLRRRAQWLLDTADDRF